MGYSNRSRNVRALIVAAMGSALLSTAQAADPGRASMQASEVSAVSVATTASVVVGGTLSVFAATGSAVVASVETVGEGSVVVLTGASEATSVAIRIAGQGAEALGLSIGTVVEVTATATGCLLRAGGRVIAFVPDRVGYALLHSKTFGEKLSARP